MRFAYNEFSFSLLLSYTGFIPKGNWQGKVVTALIEALFLKLGSFSHLSNIGSCRELRYIFFILRVANFDGIILVTYRYNIF